MISLIFAILLLVLIVAAGCAGIAMAFLLFYIPISSWAEGDTRLSYGEFRTLYEAAPDEWIDRGDGVTYKGQALWIDCYFVGIGQLRYWAWCLKRQLFQRKAERRKNVGRIIEDVQRKQEDTTNGTKISHVD
ncbi:MAG: hypothetical protein LUF84_02460 [Clostridiales bacterium]|nr:hypothetical protein [Clostridiales bacterium]